MLDIFRYFHRLFGAKVLWFAFFVRLVPKHFPIRVTVTPPNYRKPIVLRLNTSDITTYEQVIFSHQYDFHFHQEPKVIVDAGANIGLSAICFARRFPKATIYAIEPEESTFKLLKENTKRYTNVIPINAAVWFRESNLHVIDPGKGNWGFRTASNSDVNESSRGMVNAVTVDGLVRQYGLEKIDLLKIDIEGAEYELFCQAERWIGVVNTIFAELHDRFRPGCTAMFEVATQNFPYRLRKGEIEVVSRMPIP